MNLPSQPLMGLIDGMEVLQYLASAGREMSGVDLAKELGIEKTKVSRILKTLSYLGFTFSTANRKYTLGPAIHILSAQLLRGSKLIKNALKYLIELTELDLIVAMGVLWRDKVAYTYHWQPGISPAEGLGRTELFPATQSSIGLILYASKSNEELLEEIQQTDNIPGFSDKKSFLDEIEHIRKKEYATTVFDNRKSIAVKIGNPAYAAIALADIDPERQESYYLEILMQKVKQIEKVGPSYKV